MIEYYYENEIRALNRNKVKYLVVGGVAVNLYGLHRLTRDLDLMVDLSESHFDKFIKVLGKLKYKTVVPKDEWNKLSAIAFKCADDEDKRIDVFLKNPIEFSSAYKRRKVFKDKDFQISCVSFDDLLVLKNKADRVRDWIDIGSLKRIRKLKEKK